MVLEMRTKRIGCWLEEISGWILWILWLVGSRLLSLADQPNLFRSQPNISRKFHGLGEQPPYFKKSSAAEKIVAKPGLVNNFIWDKSEAFNEDVLEITNYLTTRHLSSMDSVLTFWKQQTNFPILKRLAEQCIWGCRLLQYQWSACSLPQVYAMGNVQW